MNEKRTSLRRGSDGRARGACELSDLSGSAGTSASRARWADEVRKVPRPSSRADEYTVCGLPQGNCVDRRAKSRTPRSRAEKEMRELSPGACRCGLRLDRVERRLTVEVRSLPRGVGARGEACG